jgi:hypothetical protein
MAVIGIAVHVPKPNMPQIQRQKYRCHATPGRLVRQPVIDRAAAVSSTDILALGLHCFFFWRYATQSIHERRME